MTSKLPDREHGEGVEASGWTGQPAILEFKFGGSFMASDGSTEDMAKTSCHQKKNKGSCHWVRW